MTHLKTLFATIVLFCGYSFSQNSGNQEVISKRDMYSSTWQTPEGTFQSIINQQPVHYLENGMWEPIDPSLVYEGGTLVNATNAIESRFPSVFNTSGYVTYSIGNDVIKLSLNKELVAYENQLTILSSPSNSAQTVLEGNTVRYENLFADIHDEYEVGNGEVKNNLILQSVPQELAALSSGSFGFRERLSLPVGWRIVPALDANETLTPNGLFILNTDDEVVLGIPAPVFFDDLGLNDDGNSFVQGSYLIEESNGAWFISTLLPVDWLKDTNRHYPVTIDPTVTLTGVTGGWQSQNNFVDNPGFVFIGVCCGNLEHRAWLKWNVSSIPDNACPTAVELQIYVNGVGASTAELVHAYDMMTTTSTGVFGPYGAIMPAVYTDQGDGYYTSFTLTTTGYYGWYDLGPNSRTDLVQMMNSYDFYQVSLIFDNEPSTNWKRLTAGSCSLMVTYDNPPCVILPVEVANFDVTCDEGKPHLSWKTYSETNNDYFTIWKSTNGTDFKEVAIVDGQGTTQSISEYEWTGDQRESEMAYYKISQTDFDGSTEFFNAKLFNGCTITEPEIHTENGDRIIVTGEFIEQLVVADQTGRVVTAVTNHENKATITLDPEVQQGVYIVSVLYHGGHKKTVKLYLEK